MEYLPQGITLEIPAGCFPLSTDSMVLSHFIRLPGTVRVLDLGSGCGTLGLLLCAKGGSFHVTGVELTESAHIAAVENIRRNCLDAHMESICADLRSFSGKNYDICISNPPYYSGGFSSTVLPAARQTAYCSTEDLFQAAGRNLKFGGGLLHCAEAGEAGTSHRLCCRREDGSQTAAASAAQAGSSDQSHLRAVSQGWQTGTEN